MEKEPNTILALRELPFLLSMQWRGMTQGGGGRGNGETRREVAISSVQGQPNRSPKTHHQKAEMTGQSSQENTKGFQQDMQQLVTHSLSYQDQEVHHGKGGQRLYPNYSAI